MAISPQPTPGSKPRRNRERSPAPLSGDTPAPDVPVGPPRDPRDGSADPHGVGALPDPPAAPPRDSEAGSADPPGAGAPPDPPAGAPHEVARRVDLEIVGGLRALSALAGLGIVALLSFHPWVMHAVEQAASTVPLLVLVLLFSYVVSPMVWFVHRHAFRLPRMGEATHERSLGITYLLLAGGLAIVLGLLIPPLLDEARTLANSLPGYSDAIRSHLVQYRQQYSHVVPPALQERLAEATGEAGRLVASLLQQGVVYAGSLSQAVLWFVGAALMAPFLSFYFLKDHEGILDFLLACATPPKRRRIRAILLDLHVAMQNFIKGQAILCLAIFLLTYVCMLFVLPSYAIGLAMVAGICEAIPVIGPILGAVPAVIIAFAAFGPPKALLVALIYLGIQQTENLLLVPRVMGDSLGLHPLSLTLGMIVFGNVLGFWGVLLAAPLCAAVKILVVHFAHANDAPRPSALPEDGDEAA